MKQDKNAFFLTKMTKTYCQYKTKGFKDNASQMEKLLHMLQTQYRKETQK